MNPLKVTQLNIYPVKSCQGISLSTMSVTSWGPENDRRLMVVDGSHKFITARKHPQLLTVKTVLAEDDLLVSAPGRAELKVRCAQPERSRSVKVNSQVWRDQVETLQISHAADQWFSELLGLPVRLVYMPDTSFRQVDRHFFDDDQRVGFADSYPFLLTHQSSLDELNGRLPDPVPMQRFRPNIVVAGGDPWAEDHWRKMRIGNVSFAAVKPCSRCIMTTIDPESLNPAKEPLKTLSRYRRTELGVIFGQNLVNLEKGSIAIGDKVEIW